MDMVLKKSCHMTDLVFYRLQEEHFFQGTQKLTSYFEYSGTEDMMPFW